MEKDLRLKIRIKNNLILKKGEEQFHSKNQADLARKVGLTQQTLGAYINFKMSPVVGRVRKPYNPKHEIINGVYWRQSAFDLASALNCFPLEIFPEHLWDAKTRNQYDVEFQSSDLFVLFSDLSKEEIIDETNNPLELLLLKEQGNQITNAMTTLTPREEKVLRKRFGVGETADHTVEEVGREFSVTRARIRQIEAKALRKLRHPKRRLCPTT